MNVLNLYTVFLYINHNTFAPITGFKCQQLVAYKKWICTKCQNTLYIFQGSWFGPIATIRDDTSSARVEELLVEVEGRLSVWIGGLGNEVSWSKVNRMLVGDWLVVEARLLVDGLLGVGAK